MSQLKQLPVMSLQTSEPVARIQQPIIGLKQLRVLGFKCDSSLSPQPLILLIQDLRQITVDCLIIDSEDDLSVPEDIVRLQRSLEVGFDPFGKLVVSESGHRVGMVKDYSVNLEGFWIHKFYLRPPFPSFSRATHAVVDRSQIIDITPHYLVVRDPTEKVDLTASETLPEVSA